MLANRTVFTTVETRVIIVVSLGTVSRTMMTTTDIVAFYTTISTVSTSRRTVDVVTNKPVFSSCVSTSVPTFS